MKKHRYTSLVIILASFVLITFLLGAQITGSTYSTSGLNDQLQILETSDKVVNKQSMGNYHTLLIVNSDNILSNKAAPVFEEILEEMRIPYRICDLKESQKPLLNYYSDVIIATPDFNTVNGNQIFSYTRFVSRGGNLLIGCMPSDLETNKIIRKETGIMDLGSESAVFLDSFHPFDDFMIGSEQSYPLPFRTAVARSMVLSNDAEILAEGTQDNTRIPLFWKRSSRLGKYIVCNFNYFSREVLGIYASAVAQMNDIFLYPVINAEAWYIDDFPAPLSEEENPYILEDYHVTVGNFVSLIWWQDMQELARAHSIRYTGGIIESSNAQTFGELPANESTQSYYYFGDTLLNMGGEIAYNGYNHQPLCTNSTDYNTNVYVKYRLWESEEDMDHSLDVLEDFTEGLYSGIHPAVYIPPDNILSMAGRTMIVEKHPEIKAIASTYYDDNNVYVQKFEVAEDGIIETPRIINGSNITDDMVLKSLSELNMHYVASSSLRPDDATDITRGAKRGWATLKNTISSYMAWISDNAGQIDQVTASGMAAHVQRFAAVSPVMSMNDDQIRIYLNNFEDKAWLFIRINDESAFGTITGGTLTPLNGSLYLLEADQNEVVIERVQQ